MANYMRSICRCQKRYTIFYFIWKSLPNRKALGGDTKFSLNCPYPPPTSFVAAATKKRM